MSGYDITLGSLGRAVRDLTGFWHELGPWWRQRQATIYRGNTRGWAPNRPSTRVKKQRKGLGDKPMFAGGALLDATLAGAPLAPRPNQAEFGIPPGSPLRRIAAANAAGGKNLPARHPVPELSDAEIGEIADRLEEWLWRQVH